MDNDLLNTLRLAGGWGRRRNSLVLGKSRKQRHDIDKALARLEARGEARCVYVRKHGRTGLGLETWYAVDPEDVVPLKAAKDVRESMATTILCALPQAGAAGMTRTEISAPFNHARCSAVISVGIGQDCSDRQGAGCHHTQTCRHARRKGHRDMVRGRTRDLVKYN